MATTEKYTTVIELNSEQAKRNLDELRKKVESWKSDLAEAREKKMGKSFIADIRKELTAAEKELKKYDNEVARTIDTLKNIGKASVDQIEDAQNSLLRLSKEVPHNSEGYKNLTTMLDQVTKELENIKATKAFEKLQGEAAGTAKTFEHLKAEAEFVRQTVENIDTASLKQLRLAEQTARGIKEETRQGSVEYNTASSNIEKIRAKLSEVENEERKVVSLIDRYNNELKGTNNEIKMVVDETELINRTMNNLQTASVRDIEYSIKALNEQLRETERTGGNVEDITNKLKQLNGELKKVQDMQKPDKEKEGFFSRMITGLNKNWGAITQIIGAITGLSMTIRKSVEEYAKMEEAMADTRKYTGLADAAIRDLNEDLKKMDTRTSREELNALAGSAGRLGLQSKKDILEFVEAADMIGVALGDDLGEGAVDKIGKLAMAFGEDEKKGLKQAMLSTGSALNELAQNSSAQAGYLVEFTARVAGFGKQLGLTQAQIMGFGTVMDENLLKDEMAATAFGNMLTKMQTDTAKFAKIAGMDVQAFTDLLGRDANQAVLTLADSLKKADPQNMMKMLDDMGLDGSRAVGVLSTLADKIDDVRKHQARATEAYENATSVQGEFNTMNNTVQAEIEKAKKRFHELSVELGEKLLPVVKYTITSGSLLVKALSAIAGVVTRNFRLIVSLTVMIGGYTTAVQIATNWTKIWAAVTKATPWGAAAAGLALVIAAIDKYKTSMAEARKKAEELNKTEADAVIQYSEEARKIKTLDKIMRDESVSIDQRREALNKLKAIIPDYNGMLDEEGRLTRDNKKAIDDYLVSLEKQIRLKAYKDKLEELYKRQGEQEEAQRSASDKYWSSRQTNTLQGTRNSGAGKLMDFLGIGEEAGLKRTLEKADRDLADTNGKIETLKKKIADVGELADEVAKKTDSGSGSGGSPTKYESDSDRKKRESEQHKQDAEERKRRKEAEDAAKAESDAKIAAKTHEYAMGRIAYRQYIQDMAKLQLEGLQNRRDAYEKGSAEYEKLNRQMEELAFKGDQQVNRMKLDDLHRCFMLQQMEIEAQATREEITENEKQERLREIEEAYLADRVELYREGSLERMNAEWELQDVEQRNKIERERQYQQQLEQVREQYLGMSNERQLQTALDGLDFLHEKGLLKEEEYQRAIIAVRAQYGTSQTPTEQTQKTASDMLTNARNATASTESSTPIVGTIQNYQATMEKLKELYANDKQNHDAYLLAKQQATAQFCQQLASEFQTAYQGIGNLMSAASSYYGAQSDYEVAVTKKKYEKQIDAAGNNQKKVKMLQEKQAKEEAAIKTKYNRKQVKIQIAQALAQTATNVLNAYGSAAAIPVVGYILAPIAAAMALAAGMLQVATIKKQAQAQEAGYYEGGFTGGKRYRKEAGVVHEGEFVANHQAVNNPNVLPFLNFLDQAQRNNTVGSLTMQDVSRSMGAGGTTQVVTPIVNVQTDNGELRDSMDGMNQTTSELNDTLRHGIGIRWDWDEFDKGYRHYNKLKNNP